MMPRLHPAVLLLGFLFLPLSARSQSSDNAILSMDRIFKKPYLAGSRPNDPNISPGGGVITFRWDSSAQNKYRMWMMESRGTALRPITDTLLGEISWSP